MYATKTHNMPSSDLIGRIVTDSKLNEYVVVGLFLDAFSGQVHFNLTPADDYFDHDRSVLFVATLVGWTVGERYLP